MKRTKEIIPFSFDPEAINVPKHRIKNNLFLVRFDSKRSKLMRLNAEYAVKQMPKTNAGSEGPSRKVMSVQLLRDNMQMPVKNERHALIVVVIQLSDFSKWKHSLNTK